MKRFMTLLLAMLISIPLGTMSACKPYSLWDNLSSVVAFIGTSAPGFFLCLLAIYLFSVKLGWLPASGMYFGTVSPHAEEAETDAGHINMQRFLNREEVARRRARQG